jgi:hypothetical protein
MARDVFEAPPALPGWYGDSAPAVEFRLSRAYTQPNLVRFFVFGALAGFSGFCWSRDPFSAFILGTVLFGGLALYHGLAFCWRRRFRTKITARGLLIRGYFNHFVPWDNVKSFEVGGYGDSRRLDDDLSVRMVSPYGAYQRAGGRAANMGRRARLGTVHVVRVHGHKMLLRAPLVTSWAPDPYFDEKTHQLQELRGHYGTRPQVR